ncbi:phosphate ABC transporter substrate-binding/OmpA family protein [Oceaniserpentilla sp. 4NH20-0058]|uniref:phosphate ABC transporter substrate-binding/OmpA family protein n=1 Tax=Oceaniserpentilla sp. 4NH20-0058 TaxID=3127660 RepID=UPI0033419970
MFLICCFNLLNANASLSIEQEIRRTDVLSSIQVAPKPFQTIKSSSSLVPLFTIHGSNTVGESLAPSLVVSYLKAKGVENIRIQPTGRENEKWIKGDLLDLGKTVQVSIAAHGSSTGFKSLMNGDAHIWASSRPVKDKEVENAKWRSDLRSPDSEHVLGIDGLAIVVNPINTVSKLSKEQLSLIYSGSVDNWSQVGGPDLPITLFARDENSGTWDSFKNMVLGKRYSLSDTAERYESSENLVNNVLQHSGGIGFIGMAFVGKSKLLAISDGPTQAFEPTQLTVATEDYALSRRLFFYTHDEKNNEYVDEFMEFAQGVNGQAIVRSEGFISQNVESMEVGLADNLPEDYLNMVDGAKRLSVNFRFQEGSAQLDNKALMDIQRLAYFIRHEGKGAEVLLIGFGDKRKSESRSKLLSKLRAMAVRRELARLGIYPKKTTGYGDFNPVASFHGASKVKNRRVEVWVR